MFQKNIKTFFHLNILKPLSALPSWNFFLDQDYVQLSEIFLSKWLNKNWKKSRGQYPPKTPVLGGSDGYPSDFSGNVVGGRFLSNSVALATIQTYSCIEQPFINTKITCCIILKGDDKKATRFLRGKMHFILTYTRKFPALKGSVFCSGRDLNFFDKKGLSPL